MKCQAITQNGTRCKRNAVQNKKYCAQHSRQSSPKRSPAKMSPAQREHQARYCRCVTKIKSKQPKVNPWAICTASVGRVNNSCKEFE